MIRARRRTVVVRIDLARLAESIGRDRLRDDSVLFVELQRGVAFTDSAVALMGFIGVPDRPERRGRRRSAEISFGVYNWRTDDLMIYIDDQ